MNKIRQTFLRATLILFTILIDIACNSPEAIRLWALLPVSEETDLIQLGAQIRSNPKAWEAAARFLTENDLTVMESGRYDLPVEGTYAMIQEYATRDSSKYEAHKAYIDIQVVVKGREQIFVSELDVLEGRLQDYDPNADIEFFATSATAKAVVADAHHWAILFPSDAHMPCMTLDQPSNIRKVVIKVPFTNPDGQGPARFGRD